MYMFAFDLAAEVVYAWPAGSTLFQASKDGTVITVEAGSDSYEAFKAVANAVDDIAGCNLSPK